MKTIKFLLLIIGLSLVSFLGQAQSSFTVGASASTATTGLTPLTLRYIGFGTLQNHVLYRASSLTVLQGAKIEKMVFYTNVSNVTFANATYKGTYTVKMKTVPAATLNAFSSATTSVPDMTGAITVVSSATATVNSSGEVVMTFTTPFTYTGDNLLMEFAVARGANTFTNTATPKFLAVSSGYSSGRYIYKSASTATKESTGVESFLPKTTFYYTANYTVGTSVSPVNRGSVTGGGTFTAGASATLTATPAAGYEFEKWTNLSGGALLSTDNPYTFAVNSNIDVVANFKEGANYTVTAIPGEGGTVGGSGGSYSGATYTGEYPVNAEITMTATPDEGYRFVNWTNSGSSTVSTDAAYTFNVTGNETLTAHFIATYTITPSITLITTPPDVGSAGGAITPSGPVTLDKGQNQMFTFTPDVGFRIKEVLVNGTPNAGAKTNGYYTFTDVQSNQTIDVEFMRDQNTHELTAGATHGTITPDGVTAVIENNNQTFTFAPESACYELTEVWIDGVKDAAALSAALSSLNSGSYTHTFTSVAGTHTIEVVFAIKRYTIGVAAAQLEVSGNMVDGGTVSPSTDTYDCGANVQLTATTYTGFKFVKWENQTSSQTYSSNPLAITVSGNADYVAHFEKLPELVTVPNGTGATPALATTDLPPIAIGDISAAAQHNQILYRSRYLTNLLNKDITKIVFYHTRNSSDINVAVKCTVKLMMMDASTDRLSELVDVTEATTVIASGTILIKADDGTFTLELDQPYRYTGGALLMDITVPKGAAYSVVNFHNYTSDNYLHQSRIGAVGYAMVPKTDFHYETRYLLDVSASPTAGGSADVAPEGPYVSGTPVMLTAAPNEGYRFVKWADGQGATVSTDKVHSFNVTDNGTFTAQYMATYTVTATPTAGGSIAGDGYSPATGSGVYDHGTPVTLTATPNPGYRFVNWTDGSSSLTNNAAYTFNVDANRALTANFVATYTVSASASQGGAIAPAGDSIVDHGAGVDYRFTPDLGWVLQAVLVDGENVSAGAGSYTLSNITGNRTIEAIFNQTTNTYTLTATTGMGGSVAPAAATVLEGANHTFVFTTNPGYELTKILIDGEENAAALGEALANSGSYTFTNITANRTIRAEYTAAFYTIDAVASPAVGGTVSGGGQIGKNAPVTLEATPNPGYGFVNWTKAGHEVSDEATYTFNAPGDGLYVAHFEQQPATITVADNANTNEDVPMNLVATSSTHHAQIIYRASELTGITSGSRITKMVFYHNKSANTLGNTTKCTVKIMSTGSASFPSAAFADVTSATTVVNNATISLSDNGELILTFATPYTYTGGNVLVDVSIASTFAGVGGITFYGVSVGYNAACWQQKTGTIQNAQFLPKTKFESEGVPVYHNHRCYVWRGCYPGRRYLRCRRNGNLDGSARPQSPLCTVDGRQQ